MAVAACGSSSKKTTASSSNTTAGSTSKYPPIPAGPITFGVSAPLTGPTAAYGISTKNQFEGASLPAFQAANPNGIAGHPVKLEFLDDAGDATKGSGVANQFVQDKVAAVITISYSPQVAPQQYAVLGKAKVPIIAGLNGSQYEDVSKWPYNFSIGASLSQEGKATAAYIAKKGFTKIGTISDGL